MRAVRPHHLQHQGTVEATGYFFDTTLLDEAEAQRRILTLWSAGAMVYRLPEGLLLRLAAPQWTRCQQSLGTPLVKAQGVLWAAPFAAEEFRRLNPPLDAVVLVRGGTAVVRNLTPALLQDPATWLEVSGWQSFAMQTLGPPPMPPRDIGTPPAFDVRAQIAGLPEDPERLEMLEAIRQAVRKQGLGLSGQGGGTGSTGGGLIGQAAGLLGKLAGRLRDATGQNAGANPLSDLAHRAAGRLLMASGLAGMLGRRQAEYMARMMEMFERGDLDAALRHAIPLGGDADPNFRHSLGTPSPRDNLNISLRQLRASGSMGGSMELYEHLENLYRQAFQQLERQGRIEEAAFVLAELLDEIEAAVAFLERHKRYRLAAELAESRELAPGWAVRLWFLTGDQERAVRVARRHKAFADAVLRLERNEPEKAQELRLLWAATLAQESQYSAAFEAVEPIRASVWDDPEIRAVLLTWMDLAIEQGGPAAARMLARKISLVPDAETTTRTQALVLLEEENLETAPDRVAFATTLAQGEATPLARTLARAAARSLLRDMGAGAARLEKEPYSRLVLFSGDGGLRADVPAFPPRPMALRNREEPLKFAWTAMDTGMLPLYDAAYLPSGRCVVALGELGARLLGRDGRTLVHWEQPAYRLIVADGGEGAITLAPRGEISRLAKLDFTTRKAESWCDVALRSFATDYDGTLWFVACDQDLLAIDTLSPRFEALWRLPRLGGNIMTIARSELQCSFLLFSVGVTDSWGRPTGLWTLLERHVYSLPNFYLSDKEPITMRPETMVEGQHYARALAPGGVVYEVYLAPTESGRWEVMLTSTYEDLIPLATYLEQPIPFAPVVSPDWLLIPTGRAGGIDCRLLDRKRLTERARLSFSGAKWVSARFNEKRLTFADDRGRLCVLDLESGTLLRDLRL